MLAIVMGLKTWRLVGEASIERIFTSGGSRGGPPLFLDQTEARRAEKFFFFRDRAPPYLRVFVLFGGAYTRRGLFSEFYGMSTFFFVSLF